MLDPRVHVEALAFLARLLPVTIGRLLVDPQAFCSSQQLNLTHPLNLHPNSRVFKLKQLNHGRRTK
jgi:hypothetical protein